MVAKEGFNVKSPIFILDNPFCVSVFCAGASSAPSEPSLVTLIVYDFTVPSWAVTTTSNAFSTK